jgi:hypothetical protein
MPFSSIDPLDPHLNPFILDKSKLLQAANSLNMTQKAVPVKPANDLTARAALAAGDPASVDSKTPGKSHFAISTQQIISLISRFKIRSMTFAQLKNLPLSQLNKQEKDFVNYLRRNPQIFESIAKLDNEPGISVADIKMASQIAGDSLVLSDEDLQYLHAANLHPPHLNQPDALLANAKGLKTQDLIDTIQELNPKGLTFDQLMAMRSEELALRERELQSLRFLQSPTVSKVLQKLVTPYDNMVSPEVLRVLTSLLWNPAIYGSTPIVFFQTAPLAHEADIDPVVSVNGGSSVNRVTNKRNRNARVEHPKQVVHLEAHHILDICHRLNPEGQVTLAQLRQYKPQSEAEGKALNLLRQTHIFRALAGLEHEPDYLNENDIKLALAEGALVLSDPFIVLVILP